MALSGVIKVRALASAIQTLRTETVLLLQDRSDVLRRFAGLFNPALWACTTSAVERDRGAGAGAGAGTAGRPGADALQMIRIHRYLFDVGVRWG